MEQQPTLFQLLLRQRRWEDYEVFRRRYAATAGQLAETEGPRGLATATIEKRQFMRWAHNDLKGIPRREARRILEELFHVPVDALFAPPAGKVVSHKDGSAETSGKATRCDTALTDHGVRDVVMAAAQESAHFAAHAEQSNIGPHSLEQLEADIRRIVTTYPNRPVEPLFAEARGLRDRTFELLEGRQPPSYTRDLYFAAGILCGVLANASLDLGSFPAAETQARTAFLCGELAGHNGLRAWVRGLQALVAYWDGRPGDAVRLAEVGETYTSRQGTALIRLASIKARAYGQLCRRDDSLESLRKAQRLRERLADEDDLPGGMMAFPLAKQLFYASTAHLWLGSEDSLVKAQGRAEESISLFEQSPPHERRLGELSLARMDLAMARLGREDTDGAAAEVHSVLALASRRRTESVSQRLTQFERRLAVSPAGKSITGLGLRDAILTHNENNPAALPVGGLR